MSAQYDLYLQTHRKNVGTGLIWLMHNLPEVVDISNNDKWEIQFNHDSSKNSPDEYGAYDDYFYGGNKSYAVVNAFKVAWLTHIHRNPHHWQYWILINDDPKEGTVVLEMPYRYILEMVCDWWAFSWANGDLRSIFKWWEEHREYIKLHKKSQTKVEDLLYAIDKKLTELKCVILEAEIY